MAAKKIKPIGERKKAEIRAKFERIKPEKLSKQELSYYNKIKAGKARQKNAFRDKKGRMQAFPEGFTQKYIKPILKMKGLEATDEEVRQYLSVPKNKADAKEFFENDVISWKFSPDDYYLALRRTTLQTQVFINDGNGLVKTTPEGGQLAMKEYEQRVISMGAFGFKTRIDFEGGMAKMIINLPDIDFDEMETDDLKEINEEGLIYFIISNPKKLKNGKSKKGKKSKK